MAKLKSTMLVSGRMLLLLLILFFFFLLGIAPKGKFFPTVVEAASCFMVPNPDEPTAIANCKADMAERLGIPQASIIFVSSQYVLFSDGCYNCPVPPGTACAKSLCSGFKITLRGGGWEYLYHTDAFGKIECLKQEAIVRKCPLMVSYDVGSATKSLRNRWQLVSFAAPLSGYVDKVSVKVGNYGGAERSVSCKVTDENGNNVSVIRKSRPFVGPGADWREISFENRVFKLEEGRRYYLKCKGPDSWDSLYWVWDAAKGLTTGRNYRIYLCSSSN